MHALLSIIWSLYASVLSGLCNSNWAESVNYSLLVFNSFKLNMYPFNKIFIVTASA